MLSQKKGGMRHCFVLFFQSLPLIILLSIHYQDLHHRTIKAFEIERKFVSLAKVDDERATFFFSEDLRILNNLKNIKWVL
jgi:hypothetical protein